MINNFTRIKLREWIIARQLLIRRGLTKLVKTIKIFVTTETSDAQITANLLSHLPLLFQLGIHFLQVEEPQ